MDYSNVARSGAWAKAADLTVGTRAKIIDECTRVESQFKDEKTGAAKTQDVCKVRFEGKPEALNVNLNRATIRGLVEAFGSDSKEWIGKTLTVHTEKTTVAGRRVTALYLVAEGFEVAEDAEGYVQITRKGAALEVPPPSDGNEINPDDIPF
ncbi:MAG TPA: hypothetical protein VHY35_03700 [Stellaceae bacterium]|jgi:hypothetical protein|nr:hypothetical protein [Stellaceae bacterium]